jgi:hypothetical protein
MDAPPHCFSAGRRAFCFPKWPLERDRDRPKSNSGRKNWDTVDLSDYGARSAEINDEIRHATQRSKMSDLSC